MPETSSTSDILTENRQLQSQLQALTHDYQLLQAERKLVGYEIHDTLVQDLVAAVMFLELALEGATFAKPAQHQAALKSQAQLRAALAAARDLIGSLTPPELPAANLPEAIAALCQNFQQQREAKILYSASGPTLIPSATQLSLLLRIVHEAMTNAWKHNPRANITVQLASAISQTYTITIQDNGSGFDPSRGKSGHYGLASMRERAKLLEAELAIASAPGQGTTVTLIGSLMPSE